jgi:hypothetical protein
VLTLLVQAIAISDMFTGEEMRDDVPDQPGRCGASLTNAVRVGLIPMAIIAFSFPGPALAQPDEDLWDTIPVHPGVTTVVRLPDQIERVRFSGQVAGLIRATALGDKLLIRPQRGAPPWDEVSLQVKTATVRVRFRLRLAGRARDAWRHVVVAPAVECAGPAAPAVPATATPTASASASAPGPAEPEPSAPAPGPGESLASVPSEPSASAPGSAEPSAPEGAEPAGAVTAEPGGTATAARDRDDAAKRERDADATGSPRFEVSVHAVAALVGTTELAVAGYEAIDARQPHRAFGMRVAVAPHGAWWAVETSVSGEWLAAPTVHDRGDADGPYELEVNGPWLRADVGIRARFGPPLRPTAYAGLGLQAHHRDVEKPVGEDDRLSGDMPFGGVLALGTGLEYRARDLVLGLELHIRQGVPAGYHSVAALLSVGCFLDQGE